MLKIDHPENKKIKNMMAKPAIMRGVKIMVNDHPLREIRYEKIRAPKVDIAPIPIETLFICASISPGS